ncbi:hypothetical protein A8C48_06585 [Ligilactobacillus salivarius]|nr:hypothetical protein A8C48_06585 [Ligilactobacillus salivarius]
MKNYETKKRYKMYKSGKNWIVAPLVFLGLAVGVNINNANVSADTTAQSQTTDSNQANTNQQEVVLSSENNKVEANSTTQVTSENVANNQNSVSQNQVSDSEQSTEKVSQTKQSNTQNLTVQDQSNKSTNESTTFSNSTNNQSTANQQVSDVNNLSTNEMVVTNAKYSTSVKSYAAVKTQVTNQVKNGWQQENGSWYYFNDGQQQKGWLQGGDDWYYFNNDGVMQTSWLQGGNDWYYFNPTSGRMQKSWLQGGKDWYYFNPTSGHMQKGWLQGGNDWYYFSPTSGHMQKGWLQGGNEKYSFKNDGRMIKDTWGWPFPSVGEGYFSGAQLFGVNPGGEFRMNGFHDGLDFGSIDHPGSAVHAVHSGVVTQIGYIAGLENYVVVRSDEYTFVYQEAFSNKGNISVKVGQQINTGDVIGYRDTSHLHLGITRETNVMKAIANSFNNNGTWLDPRALIKNGIANQ